jgi:hypothetical protein
VQQHVTIQSPPLRLELWCVTYKAGGQPPGSVYQTAASVELDLRLTNHGQRTVVLFDPPQTPIKPSRPPTTARCLIISSTAKAGPIG